MEHILVAVDVFNVATFWNTRTGKLIYKTILSNENKIDEAFKFRSPSYAGMRYSDPREQTDCLTQMILSKARDEIKFISFDLIDQTPSTQKNSSPFNV